MNNHSKFLVCSIIISTLLLLFIQSCEENSVLMSDSSFNGEYRLDYSDLPSLKNSDKIRLGGFSALDYIGRGEFVTVTNSGPKLVQNNNEKKEVKYLVPEFEPEIVKLELKDGEISIKDRIKMRSMFGNIYNGKPTQDYASNKINVVNNSMSIEDQGIDPQAITFDQYSNSYWIGEQYYPGILQAAGRWGEGDKQKGNVLRQLKPYEGLRTVYENQIADGGISGLDLLNNKKMIGVFKKYLENKLNDTLEIYKDRRRLIQLNPGKLSETPNLSGIYEVMDKSFDGVKPGDVKIGDIAVINDTLCIVNEYGETGSNKRNLLVKTVLPDSIWFAPQKEGIFGKAIETLTPHELDSASLSPAVKREVVDLSTKMERPPSGIAILPGNKVALLQKNNYGLSHNFNDFNNYEVKEQDIVIKIERLDKMF